jgi:hypothetical protein
MARPYPLRVLRDPCGQGFWVFWLIASCQLLAAMFSKTVHSTTFPLWSEFPTLSFCSPFCQAKNQPKCSRQLPNCRMKSGGAEPALSNCAQRRSRMGIYACGKHQGKSFLAPLGRARASCGGVEARVPDAHAFRVDGMGDARASRWGGDPGAAKRRSRWKNGPLGP